MKNRLLSVGLTLGSTAALLLVSLAGGWASAWYMVEAGSKLTTTSVGPWVAWVSAARPDADPYTRAHFARAGSLHLNSAVATTWHARVDGTGQRLHSACAYLVTGAVDAGWWSIAVFDEKGGLIGNAAERYVYTNESVALGADGRFTVTLGRDARPGNWMPTGGAGRINLVLTVLGQRTALAEGGQTAEVKLPEIRRVVCR